MPPLLRTQRLPRALRTLAPLAALLAAAAPAQAQPVPPAAVPPPPQLHTLPPLVPAAPASAPAQGVAAAAAAGASAPAAASARTRGQHPELRVIEDDTVRIEETRVRGQLQRVTVLNKLTGRAYEVQVNRGGSDPSQKRDSAGQSGWSLLNF